MPCLKTKLLLRAFLGSFQRVMRQSSCCEVVPCSSRLHVIHYHQTHSPFSKIKSSNRSAKGPARLATARIPFEKLTAIHPDRRITLETGATPLATRLIDLFVPLGFGQRALVVSPPKAGKTTILRQTAAAVL